MQYVELHCKSNFSFLCGASHPDELVQRAAELGYSGLAITDEASVAGVVRGFAPAKEAGLQYIVGTEIHPHDAPPMVLWPTDRAAYGRMCRLISRGRLRAEKGSCDLSWQDIAELSEGIVAGVVLAHPSHLHRAAGKVGRGRGREGAARKFEERSVKLETCDTQCSNIFLPPSNFDYPLPRLRPRPLPQAGEVTKALSHFLRTQFREVFDDRAYLLCELHRGVDDAMQLASLQELSLSNDVPLVAAGDVHYHEAARMLMHDCVTAIRNGTTIDQVHEQRFANSQRHLRSLAEIGDLYGDAPELLARTIEIADRCNFSLDELRYEYPEEIAPPGMTLIEHLKRLTWEGANQRWPDGVPEKVLETIRHEMRLIEELHYEAYFLTVWDLVRFARQRDILCQGRGSAANSVVCYCLGITNVDPSQTDLLFERFVSRERNEAPDIDVDFEHQRREEVLQYLYEKYGRDRAGMTATVTTYRTKSAIREVGKALGVSADAIDSIAKLGGSGAEFTERCKNGGLDPESVIGKRFVYLVETLTGFPRHLSQHVGGMVMTAGNLSELCPIENAAMEGRTVIQWDKDDLDELGILKVDVLSLGMLSALRRCFHLVRDHYGDEWTLATVPQDDKPTYDMICRADTVGVFQIESRAQMSMLPRLKPRCYYDLVIEVAIVRPGPIQGNMVHPFLKARENPAAAVYPNDAIRKVLEKTMGVPIFQEQAMKLAVVAAGFTPGEADQLRRAMAAWRRPGVIEKFRLKLLDGMKANGLEGQFAENVFHQIKGFGEYGFPESHAASFALLVYASCYLKCHYPAAFCVALLNSQPMGFYAPAQLIRDAKEHGIEVHGVDVNESEYESTLESFSSPPPLAGEVGRGSGREGALRSEKSEEKNLKDERGAFHTSNFTLQTSFFPPHPQLMQTEPTALAAGIEGSDVVNVKPAASAVGSQDFVGRNKPCAVPAEHNQPAIRLGLHTIRGLPTEAAERLLAERHASGPYRDVNDVARRTNLGQSVIATLADADVFGSIAGDRRAAVWQSLAQERNPGNQPLLAGADDEEELPDELLPMSPLEEVYADYNTTGLSLKAHPMSFARCELDKKRVVTASRLKGLRDGRHVRVAGLVLLRQRPGTAKGITFVTLEDETGTVNLVLFQAVWEHFFKVARTSNAWLVDGKLENKKGVIHVIAGRITDLSEEVEGLTMRSRDFH